MELTLQDFGKILGTMIIDGKNRDINDNHRLKTQILQNKLGKVGEKTELGKKLGTFWEKVGRKLAILLLNQSYIVVQGKFVRINYQISQICT